MAQAQSPIEESQESVFKQLGQFSVIYWIANWMELVERFAYYGVRVILPVFMVAAFEQGGPEFTHVQKGTIYAVWALVQSFVPIFTGGFADRYGFKVNIALSTVLKILGYLLMGYCIPLAEQLCGMSLKEARPLGIDATYELFFGGAMLLALGTAIFKPGLQGLIAQQMPKRYASVGWGLFYQMVNIGGFIGPMLAGVLRVLDWKYVFLACAAGIALNFIPLFFFREPERHKESADGPVKLLAKAIRGLLEPRLFFFTICFAGFWLMFFQLFDILPNFIDDWVDSREVASALSAGIGGTPLFYVLAAVALLVAVIQAMTKRACGGAMAPSSMVWWGLGIVALIACQEIPAFNSPSISVPTVNGGNMTQEWMININAFLISIFAFAMGFLTGKVKSLKAIIIGIAISAVAIYALGVSMSGWWCVGMIALFSFGEMTASPTKMRYLASIAPPGKEGLYMGYVNFTVGIGWSIGSVIAGEMYQSGGDKVVLARRYLVENVGVAADEVAAISKNDLLPFFERTVGTDAWGTRQLLWDTYEPQSMWLIFTIIGLISMVGVMLYNRVTTAADNDPNHPFNRTGHQWVRVALIPIAGVLWWATYEKLVVNGDKFADSLAVLVQAVMFSILFLFSFQKDTEQPPSAGSTG